MFFPTTPSWECFSLLQRGMFSQPPRPSFIRRAPPHSPSPFFNGLYTPFGSPVIGGQKPQERGDVAGYAIAPPEFWYRKRSLCPYGACDGCFTQQSCDCLTPNRRLFVRCYTALVAAC